MLTLYFIFRPFQNWLNLLTIKVSVKIGKVMRKEEIQCQKLNEEQNCILKTYRVRTAKKQINGALHFIVEHKCSISFSDLLISIFHYFSSTVSGSYASAPLATPLIALKTSSDTRAPHTRSLDGADLPSCQISTTLGVMGQDKNAPFDTVLGMSASFICREKLFPSCIQ